jgi:hypothetical protein
VNFSEAAEGAVPRDASEESILEVLVVNKYLGRDECLDISTNPNKLLARQFFHLINPRGIPETWQHYELHPGDGPTGPIIFEFYRCSWAKQLMN